MHLSVFILRQSRKDRFCAAKPDVQKQLRHSPNKKMYTKIHFDTTQLLIRNKIQKFENHEKVKNK
jgi:hypothetical protein